MNRPAGASITISARRARIESAEKDMVIIEILIKFWGIMLEVVEAARLGERATGIILA
jgi:hypothetical protein